MKTRFPLAALFVLAVSWAAPAHAQTLTGSWSVSSETPRGTQTVTLDLTQDGGSLAGTVALGMGRRGGGRGGMTVDISDGTVEGSAFSFTYTLEFQGNAFTQTYRGTFEGDSMQGTIEGGRGGSRPFTGTRGG